jgi:signal transduction histidine kinase
VNRRGFLQLAGTVPLATLAGTAFGADRISQADAEAMVKKTVAFIKTNGNAKAFEEVTHGKMFKSGELYVFIYDFAGVCLAHGANPKLIGKDLIALKDPDGKPFVKMMLDAANAKGGSWTEPFKFRNPTTDKLEMRISYAERLGDIAVGSGIYKE